MKVILTGDDMLPKVVCVEDAVIDLKCNDSFWDTWQGIELDSGKIDVRIVGTFADSDDREIDYDAIVTLEVYELDSQNKLYECKSPIIPDEFTDELRGSFCGVIVSRELLCEYGYDGNKPSVEKLRQVSIDMLSYWGESDGYKNALSFAISD